MSGRGKRSSPARADAGSAKASPSLLKYAISKSRTKRIRNPSGMPRTLHMLMLNDNLEEVD